jgi:type I restriction enzyme S subunit
MKWLLVQNLRTVTMTKEFKETEIGLIPEDWEIKTVKQLIDEGVLFKPIDGNHGNIHPKGSDFVPSGIPFIMASDLKNGKVDTTKCSYIRKSQANKLQKGFSKEGDVLLSHKATIGRTAIVKDLTTDYIMLTPQVTYYRIKNPKTLNNTFLKYYFDFKNFKQLFISWAESGGSTRAYLGIIGQQQLPIIIPPIGEQNKITKIIYSLDQKIELNHKMNQTLEEIGQSIFRHWFVHFDFPDENSQPYRSSGGVMVDSDLGEIPDGWHLKSLDEIANYLNGLALQKYPPENDIEFLSVIKIRELKQGITVQTDKASIGIPEEYIIDDGDIIFSWSGSLEVVIWGEGEGALNQHLFKVTSEEYPKWFYYYQTLHFLPSFRQTAADKATTMGHIKRSHLTESKVAVPPDNILKDADTILSPIIKHIINNKINSRYLSHIRDLLLPKLMSGKIRVKEMGLRRFNFER